MLKWVFHNKIGSSLAFKSSYLFIYSNEITLRFTSLSKIPTYNYGEKRKKHDVKEELFLNNTDSHFFKLLKSKFKINDFQVFKMFRTPAFYKYMNENFRYLPFLFDFKKLLKVYFELFDEQLIFLYSFDKNLKLK